MDLIIVGLGNPGSKYLLTRHNAGFLFLDFLRERWDFSEFKKDKKFFGEISTGEKNGEKVIFLKPHTFMNLTGKSVQSLVNFYKISLDRLIIISDDLDMDFGKVRFRDKGSSGGHRGLDDIFRALGTTEINRLKIGVKNNLKDLMETNDFVLAKFSKEEMNQIPKIFEEGEGRLQDFLNQNEI